MDAKSKANFINSVAAGQTIPCPNCGTANEPDSRHCISCGTALTPPAAASAPAFAQVAEDTQPQAAAPAAAASDAPAFAQVGENTQPQTAKASKYAEPTPVFADGLPSWDIVPPQVMVRRH